METDEFGKTLYVATEESDRKIVERVGEIAAKRGVSRAQVALAWMAQKPFVTGPIVGASKPHHLNEAVAALSLNLTSDEITAVEEPYTPRALAGFS
jgi:aryl-alcohol dehydrogenase-like predicted oxidoreductase